MMCCTFSLAIMFLTCGAPGTLRVMIGVGNTATNTAVLNTTYINNSPAVVGVVFALLFTDNPGSVVFTKSAYLVLDRVGSNNFTLGNISRGHYVVLAFEVGGNGRLRVGRTSPAAVGGVIVYGQG